MNMQTSRLRSSSLGVSKKTSPPTPRTPRTARKNKTQGSDSELVIRSPSIKKKCPVRVSELESQLVQLQAELEKAKDQLGSSESLKQKAELESEELRRHLTATSKKLEETQKQLEDFSDSEEARLQELRKISHERDRAWQSEVEAVQKQSAMHSAALASALNEVQRLRVQLDASEAEVQKLRMELNASLSLVEESGEKAVEEISKAEMQVEVANITKGADAYKSLDFEVEQSKNKASKSEEIVGDEALADDTMESNQESEEHKESHPLKDDLLEKKVVNEVDEASNFEMEVEVRRLKVQVEQWRKAAEAATAMLSTGSKLGSIYFEDMDDDESLKKKNGNMLRKIGTLLKKK